MKRTRATSLRNLVLLLLSVCLVFACLAPVPGYAAAGSDIEGSWAKDAILRWKSCGVLNGSSDGNFYPDKTTTRAEAAQIFINLLKLQRGADVSKFTDIPAGAWYANAIGLAHEAGLMNGIGNTMSPMKDISREEFFFMLAKALGIAPEDTCYYSYPDLGQLDGWSRGYVYALINKGAIHGTGNGLLSPKASIDRASIAAVLDNIIGTYVYEDCTVDVSPGFYTLIAAEKVSLTGTAEGEPIVISQDYATIDCSELSGSIVLAVTARNVSIKDLAPGSTILAPDAEFLTVNAEYVGPVTNYTVPNEDGSVIRMDIPEGTFVGDRIADFTFTDANGVSHSLYETLKTKDMVLINIWATWCPPCRAEFPYMNAAYNSYKDSVEIFALSVGSGDTDSVIRQFAADEGIDFIMGQDTPDLNSRFSTGYIPISVVVDRYGVICMNEVGAASSERSFTKLFDIFTSSDYPESVLLDGMPY